MFHDLIVYFFGFVRQLIATILGNDLLAYSFYIGILGFVIVVLRFFLYLNNSSADNFNHHSRKD